MAITNQQIADLRKRTGVGILECKKALTEADGDMEKAVEILRKKGAAIAAKRADRETNEGKVLTKINAEGTKAVMVEVNSETDFVSGSDDFQAFAKNVLEVVYEKEYKSVEELMENEAALNVQLNDLTAKIGEKMGVGRVAVLNFPNGYVVDYIHTGAKLGVLVGVDSVDSSKFEALRPIARDIAMQAAAMSPIATSREEVPSDVIEKEIEVYKELAKKEGKPDAILDKIAQGKLSKFYQENCLAEQSFVKDNSKIVGDLIKEFNAQHGTTVKLATFVRFQIGDKK